MDMHTQRNNSDAVDSFFCSVSKTVRYTDKCVSLISANFISDISDCTNIRRVQSEMWAQKLAGLHVKLFVTSKQSLK